MLRTISLTVVALGALLLSACGSSDKVQVTGISPKEGPYQGGDPVTISGNGFEKVRPSTVYFNDRPARIISVEDAKIVVEPPGGNVNEKVTIKVAFDNSSQWSKDNIYTYIEPTGGFDVEGLTGGDKKDEPPKK